jgi:hypothetical protein
MTIVEVTGIFWGCGMIAGAVLIHASVQSKQIGTLYSIVTHFGLVLLMVSATQGWESIDSYHYTLNFQDSLNLQDPGTVQEAEIRGRTIFSAFMLLSGAIAISASLNMLNKSDRTAMLIGGTGLCVFGLMKASYQININWALIAFSLAGMYVGLMSPYLLNTLARRLNTLFRQRS